MPDADFGDRRYVCGKRNMSRFLRCCCCCFFCCRCHHGDSTKPTSKNGYGSLEQSDEPVFLHDPPNSDSLVKQKEEPKVDAAIKDQSRSSAMKLKGSSFDKHQTKAHPRRESGPDTPCVAYFGHSSEAPKAEERIEFKPSCSIFPELQEEAIFKERESSFSSEDSSTSTSSLQFSLYYDIQLMTLTVTLMKGINLTSPGQKSVDPIVNLYLDPNREEILESQVKHKDSNPIFNETFHFHKLTSNELPWQKLIMRVYNYAKSRRNECLGSLVLPLKEADLLGASITMVLTESPVGMNADTVGDVLLLLMYSPHLSCVKGTVLKATNLQKKDLLGSADPYVKIYLEYQGKRVNKWKTSIKKNTLIPVYNESFRFSVSQMSISEVSLRVLVMDYDRFSANDLMGETEIGGTTVNTAGKKHWDEMIRSPLRAVSRWHSLCLPETRTRTLSFKRKKAGEKEAA